MTLYYLQTEFNLVLWFCILKRDISVLFKPIYFSWIFMLFLTFHILNNVSMNLFVQVSLGTCARDSINYVSGSAIP